MGSSALNKYTGRYIDFLKEIENKGYSLIGDGLYAYVYAKPYSKRVIKVFSYDVPYLTFLNRIRNLKNPYFPKIYKVAHYQGKADNWTVVEMERLKPLSGIPKTHRTTALKNYDEYIADDSGTASNVSDAEAFNFDSLIRDIDLATLKDRALKRAIIIIQEMVEQFCIDLHGGNVMLRKEENNYRLVFIDPVFYRPSFS